MGVDTTTSVFSREIWLYSSSSRSDGCDYLMHRSIGVKSNNTMTRSEVTWSVPWPSARYRPH